MQTIWDKKTGKPLEVYEVDALEILSHPKTQYVATQEELELNMPKKEATPAPVEEEVPADTAEDATEDAEVAAEDTEPEKAAPKASKRTKK